MWVIPTYHRAFGVQRALDSAIANGSRAKGVVFLDGSNEQDYRLLQLPDEWQLIHREPNRGVCATLNETFARFPDEPWYGFLSDDSCVRTDGWEEKLLAAGDSFSIAHSNDGWQSEARIHGAVIFGGELLRTLGWWVPPGLRHSFCDDVWEELAKGAQLRRYVPEVMVEHLHVMNHKAPLDSSYLSAYGSYDSDRAAFLEWKREELARSLEKIAIRKNSLQL